MRSRYLITFSYCLMILAAAGAFLAIRSYGERMTLAGVPRQVAHNAAHGSDILLHVLLALTAIVVLGRSLRPACPVGPTSGDR